MILALQSSGLGPIRDHRVPVSVDTFNDELDCVLAAPLEFR